jgi:G3E family GTPase
VTVIDCVNFRGYEDDSPSAKLQAQYTDLHILSKHEDVSERDFDILLDRLGDLTDSTPHVKISREKPLTPELVFGLDSTLFLKGSEEADTWAAIGGEGAHIDEVQTKSVWRGGRRPGGNHEHADGKECGSCKEEGTVGEVQPLPREELEAQLKKFEHIPEIYRSEFGVWKMAAILVRLADLQLRASSASPLPAGTNRTCSTGPSGSTSSRACRRSTRRRTWRV